MMKVKIHCKRVFINSIGCCKKNNEETKMKNLFYEGLLQKTC